jgi:hypothetical protein
LVYSTHPCHDVGELKIIRNFLKKIVFKHPALFFFFQLFQLNKVGSEQGTINFVHDLYKNRGIAHIALDLGCGPTPSNKFEADEIHGLDLVENIIENI